MMFDSRRRRRFLFYFFSISAHVQNSFKVFFLFPEGLSCVLLHFTIWRSGS
jgi:hypothetical protein